MASGARLSLTDGEGETCELFARRASQSDVAAGIAVEAVTADEGVLVLV